MALRKLLSKKERIHLKERCRYQSIDPNAEDKTGKNDRKIMRLFSHVKTVNKQD